MKFEIRNYIIIVFFLLNNYSFGQTVTEVNDIVNQNSKPFEVVDVNNFAKISALIKGLDTTRILGIGEGTHGTKEFILLRTGLSKTLIVNGKYRNIFLESSFGDVQEFNRELNDGVRNIDSLMKKKLFSIYQTQEYSEFFKWLQGYNKTLAINEKVQMSGIDFALISTTAKLLKKALEANSIFRNLCDTIVRQAVFQDSIWINMNRKDFQFSMKNVVINGALLVSNVHVLQELAANNHIELSSAINLYLMNLEHAGEPFYAPQKKRKTRSRDELMAQMANKLLEVRNFKTLIWAHNAHVSYEPAIGNSGGMGGFLKKLHHQYFSLATGTSSGEYNATTDRFINNDNKLLPYALNKPVRNSWESAFDKLSSDVFYLNMGVFKGNYYKDNLKFRLLGYGIQSSSEGDYTKLPIGSLFDGLIFIKITSAPKTLN